MRKNKNKIILFVLFAFAILLFFLKNDFTALIQFAKEINQESKISYIRICMGISIAVLGSLIAVIFFQSAKKREKKARLAAEEALFTKTEVDLKVLIDSIKGKDSQTITRILSLLEPNRAFEILDYLQPHQKVVVRSLLMERLKNNDYFTR